MAKIQYYVGDHRRPAAEDWVERLLPSKTPITDGPSLCRAILELEDGASPEEVAEFYAGSWIIWKTRWMTFEESFVGHLDFWMRRFRSQMFVPTPSDEDFEALEKVIVQTVVAKVADAIKKKTVSKPFARSAVITGDPIAKITLTGNQILLEAHVAR
jgi:hypothetical protein